MWARCGAALLLTLMLFNDLRVGDAEATRINAARDPDDDGAGDFYDDQGTKLHYALIIAGSNSWYNYRHQADVCHAYQVLRRGGLHPSRIVTMMYDDLAASPYNPLPGQIINRPGGPDVYKGVIIDYRGEDVNSETFLAVLAGDAEAVKGKGSGKVISSGPMDRVFVFYSDHGSPGVLGMPSGSFLFADQLMSTLTAKHAAGGYREMVMYIEACESGSMFEGLLGPELNVYVTTAANALESSWGTYCPGQDPGPAEGFDTCLGDLYSVAVMEDCDTEDLALETLQAQFQLVSARTSNNFTYVMGSHAQQYGTLRIEGERAGSYLGMRNRGDKVHPLGPSSTRSPTTTPGPSSSSPLSWRHLLRGFLQPAQQQPGHHRQRQGQGQVAHHAVLQRDADLEPLRARAAWAPPGAVKEAAEAKLRAALQQRAAVDNSLAGATQHLLGLAGVNEKLLLHLGLTGAVEVAADLAVGRLPLQVEALARELQYGHMGRPNPHQPLVDSWDCLRGMVRAYEARCGRMDQYAMRHTRLFANLCNAGLQPAQLGAGLAAVSACSVQMAAVQ